MLELYKGQGDLSRRLSAYTLPPLLFREFLELEHKIRFPVIPLNEIVTNHIAHSHKILDKIKPLVNFAEYLNYGAFPFFKDSRTKYHERMENVVKMILDYDLPSITPIHYATY